MTGIAPLGAGLAYDLLGSYDPLIWGFVVLSALAAGAALLVRADSPNVETATTAEQATG
jgi:hypothetical protein